MSFITENTIVFRSDELDKFLRVARESDYIREVVQIFHDTDYTVCAFDCNGQPLELEENINFLVLETNYLDGEPFYTQVRDFKSGDVRDARYRAKYWIKKLIGEDEFNAILPNLIYTDGRV